MANEFHLGLIGSGKAKWDEFRNKHPATVLDLSESKFSEFKFSKWHLIGAQFCGSILGQADFRSSNLQHCNFNGAQLVRANFEQANLKNASFIGADLTGAKFGRSDLTDANFCGAALHEVDFSSATLKRNDFSEASFLETFIVNVTLRDALNLENAIHVGPSVLDNRTLQNSGILPINFLRGVGFSNSFIECFPSLYEQPIQFHSSFISYSNIDEKFAKRLYSDLQSNGVRCWFAPEDMKIGDRFRSRIDQVIHLHEKLLLILSEDSVNSAWVEKEVETALEKEIRSTRTVLFPIRLDDRVMNIDQGWPADIRRTRHIGDFRNWKDPDAYDVALARLLRDLKIEIEDNG